MLGIYQVCYGASYHIKEMGVVLLKPEVKTQWTVLLGYLTSYFLRNISAKNHQNQFTYVKVTVSQRCELF